MENEIKTIQDPELDAKNKTSASESVLYTINSPVNSSVHQAAATPTAANNTMTILNNHSTLPTPSHFNFPFPASTSALIDNSQPANDQYPLGPFEQPPTTAVDPQLNISEPPQQDTDAEQAHSTMTTKNTTTKPDDKMAPAPSLQDDSLNRNRIAASKCRKRKNELIERLEQVAASADTLHTRLSAERLCLLQEISMLKSQIIRHAACRSPRIDVWIANEAVRYVRELADEASPSLSPLTSHDDS
ncbi:hypothetical protein E4U55_007855 [Claviceps digitariae]|nr:hypothetical protein E4U55_007855 [Claviceps digitariae]